MSKLATTKMSSKGQVVIPKEIRRRLDLAPGERFVVLGEKGVVVLKKIDAPSMKEFDEIVETARRQAREAGMKPSDIPEAIHKARRG